MRPIELVDGVRDLISRTPAYPGKALIVDIIANPNAGGFKRRRFAFSRHWELAKLQQTAFALPKRDGEVKVRLHLTERCGHASAIAQRVVERSLSNGVDSLHIIMTAGGDGTSLETAERLIHLAPGERDRFALLRLPMGTGNDGSEGRNLLVSLGRFFALLTMERRAAVRVIPSMEGGKMPLWSFNIASVGLDAYVADKTNRLKAMFPGDSYKFWVNVATLLYDRAYKVAAMRLRAWDSLGSLVFEDEGEKLFVALGSSGHRQYGSNKKILPGNENGIAVSQTSLFRKLLVKGAIEQGRHEHVREVRHFDAAKIEMEYPERIPLQCDGEAEILARCDFPLAMERVPDLYNVLVPAPESKS
ncbi:MAG: diacylglycerol kinase [Spirochaetes bacterium]|nr:MAG: diacylglycerol kinase [Spirochaetota bacterium]